MPNASVPSGSSDLAASGATLETASGPVRYQRLSWLAENGSPDPSRLPHTVKVLLENLLRRAGTRDVSDDDVRALAGWPSAAPGDIAFMPARVLMQDFTGVPAVVDLAALRSAVARGGGDPQRVDPHVPVDLIIDHSVQVDLFRSPEAYQANIDWEYRRNSERYSLLRWSQQAFEGVRVVPPGAGICHQVNLEHLGRVVCLDVSGVAYPDTLVGTDSHTTMINGLGVLGWGVGGIEAEAAMLGQPMFLPPPDVVGVRVQGALPPGTTATDLVLTLTQMLRSHGVVGRFVEFFGAGLSTLELADRATLSNMCPEYGATSAYFPVDEVTLRYLKLTGRGDIVDLVQRYTKEQGLFRTDADPEPAFTEVLDLDLSAVVPSVAGPRRPQDRVALPDVWNSFVEAFRDHLEPDPKPTEVGRFVDEGGSAGGAAEPQIPLDEQIDLVDPVSRPIDGADVLHGSVVIAAITSCTNTSNPSVMLAAGLLARKAVEAGLETRPWVKTSLAPGSRVVTDYLDQAGLTPYLEKLGFSLVGYGCTTCIGNSGPLPDEVAAAVEERDLAVVAVLSGNRNFEGRIHPQVRASYLASPPLCVAYALAGRIDVDLTRDPIGEAPDGEKVYLRDLWPSPEEVRDAIRSAVSPEQFDREYGRIFDGDERWRALPSPEGPMYEWDPDSTYVREPPFFSDVTAEFRPPGDLVDARALVMVGDSITTDHISPAGAIKLDSPAGRYLLEHGVQQPQFNSYGARRGNHEVMMRGTFANVRLQNLLAPGTEGPWTTHLPDGERMSIFDAALRYREEGVPLVVLAGAEYGSGSSRDWAAKGPALLGVRAVVAESFERIHRSNLVGMGILPLQFMAGSSAASLGLTGREAFTIRGVAAVEPGQEIRVEARGEDGSANAFPATVRIDAPAEIDYFRNGGILRMVLRQLLQDQV
ncbi:MAG: aconitate hydratase AcnA [Actinomycetota bacterium]|nr:aconitate hydratase AcnA [Actinomycetota bacterium]